MEWEKHGEKCLHSLMAADTGLWEMGAAESWLLGLAHFCGWPRQKCAFNFPAPNDCPLPYPELLNWHHSHPLCFSKDLQFPFLSSLSRPIPFPQGSSLGHLAVLYFQWRVTDSYPWKSYFLLDLTCLNSSRFTCLMETVCSVVEAISFRGKSCTCSQDSVISISYSHCITLQHKFYYS